MNKIVITPTCVPHSFDDVTSAISAVQSFAHSIHLDIDDGIFTPQISWPYQSPAVFSQSEISKLVDTNLPAQVHLMVKDPHSIGMALAHAGVETLVVHVEALDNTDAGFHMIREWRETGIKQVGIAILLETPLQILEPLVPSCNFVQIMSVATIGAQGAPFDTRAIDRVRDTHTMYPSIEVAVDGGVSENNIKNLVAVGAHRFYVGASIMQADNPGDSYTHLQSLAESAIQ